MKKISLFIALLFSGLVGAYAQTTWTSDPAHSSIEFNVTHMMISEVTGKFDGFEAVLKSDKVDFSDAKIEFTAQTSTINTGIDKRDEHLKSADFFDVEKYPTISFKSTSFKKKGGNKYELKGDLTMHGVTKPVTLEAKFNGTIKDPYGNTKSGFKVTGEINRTEFGLNWNSALETGGVVVSEEVEIDANIQVIKSVDAGK
ncbi:YceI family protein [Chondrinema litorale]|uniref:YceI family protein n=1 Tax=Chondrinema litorale TaxID=2994555 RepID=UPI00254298AA|nr:YceI family protein [Chondrinema litorale]UZR92683.1 YceI family protein [Chondrinema litorale]